MNPYELMLIHDPGLGDDKIAHSIAKVEEKIKGLGGTIRRTEKWGAKRLATPFQKHKKISQAYYTLIFFEAPTELPPKLLPILKVTEEILRYAIYSSTKEDLEGVVQPVAAAAPTEASTAASVPHKKEEDAFKVDFSKLEEKGEEIGQP